MEIREVVAALEGLERGASARVFASARAGGSVSLTARDAIEQAVAAAWAGGRASAVIAPEEALLAASSIAVAARARAPIVVHVANASAASAGLGWVAAVLELDASVIVTWDAADALAVSLAARRTAEDSETPVVSVLDLARAAASGLAAVDPAVVASFVGAARAPSPAASSDLEAKRGERAFTGRVPYALAGALREIGEATGRALQPIERFETLDAEEVVVAFGAAYPAAHAVAAELRAAGRRAGAVGVRSLRPFFAAELVKILGRAKTVGVLEPLDVALAPCGPVAAMLKGAFADAITWAPGFPGVGHIPPIVSAGIATIGEDGGHAEARALFAEVALRDRARRTLVFGSAPA